MGLFDFLFGGEEAQLKRHARRIVNLNAQSEEREASAQWLAELGTPEAIQALLNRYTIKYEQGMKDAAEKESVYRLLLGLGPKVVEPVAQWARGHEQFAHALRIIEHFQGPEAAVGLLLEMLAAQTDPFKPEKKRQILIHMADFRDARIVEGAASCLQDFDEGVRYAATDALLAQEAEPDRVRELLLARLADPEEDSNRSKVRIAEAFHQRRWTLGEAAARIQQNPPHGWAVQGDRIYPTR